MTSRIAEVMADRPTEELRSICSDQAPDYTEEAQAAARAELERRGEDVTALVPRAGEPSGMSKESLARLDKLGLACLSVWLVLGALGTMIPPLRTLSSVFFWAAVLVGLRRISR